MREKNSRPATPISRASFCAVDVETSGLRATSRLVEVGAVRFNLEGRPLEHQALLNPCEGIDPAATSIHGITDEMVKSAPLAADVLPGLLNFMRGSVFIAHNAAFDAGMITSELLRTGCPPPDNPVICTVDMARNRLPGMENYRLGTLVEKLGIEPGRLHNALPDARAAMGVFLEGISGLAGETPVCELPGFRGTLYRFAERKRHLFEIDGKAGGLELLARSRVALELDYGPVGVRRPAVVTPLYLFTQNSLEYLRAYCHREGIQKTYRTDRIFEYRKVSWDPWLGESG